MRIPSRTKRHPIYCLDVFDPQTGRHLGRLLDISTEGMCIQSHEAHSPSSSRQVRIPIPGKAVEDGLECRIEVRWSTLDTSTGSHFSGFAIPALTERQQALVLQMVQRFGYARVLEPRPAGPSPALPHEDSWALFKRWLWSLFGR